VFAALQSWLETRRRPVARLAVNLAPRTSPYGGGNQFVLLLARYLGFYGYRVTFNLEPDTDAVLIIDGRREVTAFGADEIAALKKRRPSLVCIHRVNECDQRKGTTHIDDMLARTNALADHTVFISSWLRDYHAARWFDRTHAHSVILNGADPRVFHPVGARAPETHFRIATHHWSNNARKGFDVYTEIDDRIAAGSLPQTELWVIGRWPEGTQWRSARLFPPCAGTALADLLRQCHAYVTGSRWEPGGMHYIEAAQCGLPVAYHEDGGGIVELASRFGVGYRDAVEPALQALRTRLPELRRRLREHAPSGDGMCREYRRLLETLLASRVDPATPAVEPTFHSKTASNP
jgi:glycosyltransferase involved in cell wall biosynthesis